MDLSPLVKSFVAGSVSGTCSTLLFQPLDLIKTRLQTPGKLNAVPSGMFATLTNIVKNEKVFGLWKGVSPSMTRCVPGVGLYFSSLHWLKTTFGSGDPGALEAVMLGCMARTFAGAALIPVTVIKTRYESGVYQYRGVTQALRVIYVTEGPRGLICGLLPTLMRDVPFSGLYLMFYTQAKKAVHHQLPDHAPSPYLHFSCGIVAGLLASFITQPADVIKTQMQLYPEKFSSLWLATRTIYQNDGVHGYLVGLAPRLVRRTLMAAMAWTVYEQVTHQLGLK